VVFNHTAAGTELGPTVRLRGIDNAIYYWLADDSAFVATSPVRVRPSTPRIPSCVISSSMRYWVMEMHVDGFRFDLASVLGRDRNGRVLRHRFWSVSPKIRSCATRSSSQKPGRGRRRSGGKLLRPPLGGMEWPFS
jgi:pullulanase/glycogen debranching enzyme